jgi:hypothetical protein
VAAGGCSEKGGEVPSEDSDPLPPEAVKWSVNVDGTTLNYGQVHEMIHRDIAMGNDYRKERIKLLTTLATGVFALTVTFHKDMFSATLTRTGLWLILLGWAALIASLLAGIIHFRKWEDFYLEHRAKGNAVWKYRTATDEQGRETASAAYFKADNKIEALRESYKKWNLIQSGGLVVGLALIAAYVVVGGFAITAEKSKPFAPHAATEQVSPAK